MAKFKNIYKEEVRNLIKIDVEFLFPITYEEFEYFKECYENVRIYETIFDGKIIVFTFLENKNSEIIEKLNQLMESKTYWILLSHDSNEIIKTLSNFFLKFVDEL